MITSQNPQSTYTGNGVATTFDYTFQVPDPTFILVTSSASVNPLVLNQDYTVSGVGQTNSSLWFITFTTPPANLVTITITPNLPLLQSISFASQSNFYPQTVEQALDYLTLLIQQQQITLGQVGSIASDVTSANAAAALATTAASQAQTYAAALAGATTQQYDQSEYGVASGTNTYAVSLTPAATSYTTGMSIVINFTNANTGASTINVNGLGAKNIYYLGANITSGQIAAGQIAQLTYDGTNFNLLDPALAVNPTYAANTFVANLTGGTAAPTGVSPLQARNAIDLAFATVASASSTAIGGASSNYVKISGATNISSFDTVASGIIRTVTFQGALTLANSAALILPGGANITTAAGDVAIFVSEGSGTWRCVSYTTASGLPISSPASAQLSVVALTASSGNWTVPSGITQIKVTVIGGGGSGGGNTGNAGNAGGTTTFNTTLSATGGAGGSAPTSTPSYAAPGVGSGGLINVTGGYGQLTALGVASFGGSGAFGFGSPGAHAATSGGGTGGQGYGAGGGAVAAGSGSQAGNGAGGGGAIGFFTGLTPGTALAYTIGAGGSSVNSSGSGAQGVILIEY